MRERDKKERRERHGRDKVERCKREIEVKRKRK